MTDSRVLSFSKEVREAALDARAIRLKQKVDGHKWAPALAKANTKMVELALTPIEATKPN